LATSRHKIVDAFKSQRFSLVLAFLGVIGVCVFVGLSSSRLPPRFQQAAILTVFFMPALLATAVLGVIMQASIALRQLRFAAEANIAALGAGLLLSFLFAKPWHLFGMAVAECITNILTAVVILIRINAAEASR
jgi:O-antigen/teichoic acid export membrane protein